MIIYDRQLPSSLSFKKITDFSGFKLNKIHNEDLIVFTLLKAENVTYYIFKLIVMLYLKLSNSGYMTTKYCYAYFAFTKSCP